MARAVCGQGELRRKVRAALWLASPLMLLGACWLAGLRVNLTTSMPIGLYIVTHRPVTRGSMGLACLPSAVAAFARERGYVPHGHACSGGTAPVGKLVLAVPGDTVAVSRSGLSLNGVPVPRSRPLPRDTRGRPLPRLEAGTQIVGVDTLWLVSRSAIGFDSRYFGPIHASSVLCVIRSLWTPTLR